jgi:hypothetical protein
MRHLRNGLLAVLAALGVGLTPMLVLAEEHGSHHVFHEREVAHFRGHDLEVWRGGHWHHGWIGGRFGWWWFAGGIWYFYDVPVYPYPPLVSEVTIIEPMAPPVMPQAPAAPAYYYCDNPAGYYPHVTVCSVPFRPVPIAPPGAVPPGAPPAGAVPPPPGAIPAPPGTLPPPAH